MATTYEQLAYKEIPGQKEKEVYNPTTGKVYGTRESLATDLGIAPTAIDWTKIGTGMSADQVGQGTLTIPTAQSYSPTNAINYWQSTAAGMQSQMESYQKTLESQMATQPTMNMTDTLNAQYDKWGVSGMFDQLQTWTNEANAVRQNIATLQDQENQALLNIEGKPVSLATIKGRQSIVARQYDSKIAAEGARLAGYGAMIEATRGNLSMAQSFANEFVQAATYDYQVKRDTWQAFYNYNKDMFSYLGSQYESAVKNMVDAADKEYQRQYEEKQQVAQLILQYPTAGIMATDTLEQALAKAQGPAAQMWNAELARTNQLAGVGEGTTAPIYYSDEDWRVLAREAKNGEIPFADALAGLASSEATNKERGELILREVYGMEIPPRLKNVPSYTPEEKKPTTAATTAFSSEAPIIPFSEDSFFSRSFGW